MRFLRQLFTIAAKDLRSELRTKEAVNASLSFAMVILLLFSFAFDPTSDMTREISGGLLWLVFAFAGTLVLNRSFARELNNDCLDALIASPVSGPALFLGKALANYVLLLGIECFCLPVFGIFYNIHWTGQLAWLALVLLLGTWGMTVGWHRLFGADRQYALARTDAADAGLSHHDSVPDGVDAAHYAAARRPADYGRAAGLGSGCSSDSMSFLPLSP